MIMPNDFKEINIEFYPLNVKFRVLRPIRVDDGGLIIRGYGPYGQHGMNDCHSWGQVLEVWAPDTRIFARLPVHEDDAARAIPGKKPYIVVGERRQEKINVPFGYGESSFWYFYEFRNIGKKEATTFLERLIQEGIEENRYNVGLELRPDEQDLANLRKKERQVIDDKVRKFIP